MVGFGLAADPDEELRERIEREKAGRHEHACPAIVGSGCVTLLISVAVQFVALRVPQLPPSVFFTRNGVSIVVALGALPWLGRKATMRARGAAGL
jgi:hypothetical protein